MSTTTNGPAAAAFDLDAERAVLGGAMLTGDPRTASGLVARGLRPEHFYWQQHANVFTAINALAERAGGVDLITITAEMERLGLAKGTPRDELRQQVDVLNSYVPAAGHVGEYADIVIELARWRQRQQAVHRQQAALNDLNERAWTQATSDLEVAIGGTRTESLGPEAWGALMFDALSQTEDQLAKLAVPTPFRVLTEALGGGLRPGEWCAVSGPTSMGKSVWVDQWLDFAAKHGKRCHLYMTEMTAINRGYRYLARQTGVPYMAQRRGRLSDEQRQKLLGALGQMQYGCTIAADWDVDDIVHDALRARYDFVVVDLLHGFHYEDERGLDRLSKAIQKLCRGSTTLDGFAGTAAVAVCHLKEEGLVRGKIPRPTISSIKGGSSIKQDADFVSFVWQEQEEGGRPSGEGEIWLAKGRSGELACQDVTLNGRWFRFDSRNLFV